MIESYANADDPFKVLKRIEKEQGPMFRAEREEYGDLLNDIRIIMTEYFAFWDEKSLVYVRMKGKAAEHTFEIEIAPGIFFTGKIDNIGKTPNKLRWLVEHKSARYVPNEDHRWRNLQSVVYVRANDMLGLPPLDGTCWDYIRSKPPTAPEILKSGQMSRRGIDTLPTKVLETLKAEKLNPKDFAPLIKSAENNRRQYFQRIFTPIKKKVADIVFTDFVETAKEMAQEHDQRKERNIDRHCEWCEFEPLCRGELQGLDIDFIRKKEYEKHEKQPEIEPDFEG